MVTDEALDLVEATLEKAVGSDISLLTEASQHIICSGGKRLRPRMFLLSYEAAGGGEIQQAVPVAAAVELLHTASLIHDDIIDFSDTRRGKATVNAQWGDHMALLAGDFLFFRFFDLITSFESRVIRVLADCCTAIVEGETLELLQLGDTGIGEKGYLAVVTRKTASLFSSCAELGAILAGGTDQQVDALREYGLNFGIAFQIRDDMLDMVGSREELGKPVANDLKQGNMTLAMLFAIRKCRRAEEILRSQCVEQVVQVLCDTGALDYAMQQAKEYSERAKEALRSLPESEAKAALLGLADFVVARDR